tara:strand:- start:682 stop:864 length:183 start_codon:yes stop_codon:yes gene_type:complete
MPKRKSDFVVFEKRIYCDKALVRTIQWATNPVVKTYNKNVLSDFTAVSLKNVTPLILKLI